VEGGRREMRPSAQLLLGCTRLSGAARLFCSRPTIYGPGLWYPPRPALVSTAEVDGLNKALGPGPMPHAPPPTAGERQEAKERPDIETPRSWWRRIFGA
jgi:hypothetical protein